MAIFSGFTDSFNLNIVTLLFPFLVWIWIYNPSNSLNENAIILDLISNPSQSSNKNIKVLTQLTSNSLQTIFPMLTGFILSFTFSITLATASGGTNFQTFVSLSGLAFGIVAYLNWKLIFTRFHTGISFILGFFLASVWVPAIGQNLASILFASLNQQWSILLFSKAFAYSVGVGITLYAWIVVTILVVFICQTLYSRFNVKSHAIGFKNKILNSYLIRLLKNSKFTKEKWYIKFTKQMSFIFSNVFSKSSLHMILVFYGICGYSGLLETIQIQLLILTWTI